VSKLSNLQSLLACGEKSCVSQCLVGGPSDSGGGGTVCHQVTGDSSTRVCGYSSSSGTCTGFFSQPGPCPTPELTGCCVHGGTSGTCYYDTVTFDMSDCTKNGGVWHMGGP